MKKINKVTQVFLLTIIIFIIIILPIVVFNLSFAKFFLSKILFVISFSILSLIFSFAVIKNRIQGVLFILFFVLFLSFILSAIKILENDDKEKVVWNSDNDSFTTDFIVGKDGCFYLNSKINEITGLFLFDTGCELSNVNEKSVSDKKMKLQPYTVTDANGIKQTKNVFKVKLFEFGAIEIEKLHVYPTDSITWTDPKGIHYKQDSIFGIIGNNIISKFIWDFDLIHHRVTVSNKKTYCNAIPDSLAISLVSKDNHKEIPVLINGENKLLTLDFGCCFPIVISDSIHNRTKFDKKSGFWQKTNGLLNHLDSTGRRSSNFDFADIKVGSFKFEQIKCFENGKADLFGIPFIWAFKRVIIDFMNGKAYFISENDSSGDFGVNKFNRESIWNPNGICEMKSKPRGITFDFQIKSTRMRWVVYGDAKLFNNNNIPDSIFCKDSLLMPNGKMKYGPYTIRFQR